MLRMIKENPMSHLDNEEKAKDISLEEKNISFFQSLKEMLQLTKRADKALLSKVIVSSFISGLAAPGQLWILGEVTERLIGVVSVSDVTSTLFPWLLGLSILRLLGNFSVYWGDSNRQHLEEKMTLEIQSDLFLQSIYTPYSYFENQEFYNALHRANEGMGGIFLGFIFQLVKILENLVKVIGYVWITLQASWVVPSLLLIGGIPIFFLQSRFNVDRYALTYDQTTDTRLMHYFVGLLSSRRASKEIRLFAASDYLIDRWQGIYNKLSFNKMKQERKQRLIMILVESFPILTFGFSLFILLSILRDGEIGIGVFVIALYALTTLQSNWEWTIRYFGWLQEDYQRFVKDLLFFTRQEKSIPDKTNQEKEEQIENIPLKGVSLSIRDLSFSYPNSSHEVLKNINLEIVSGEKIALLGVNGSGKSTLVKIILGLLEPSKGKIILNGQEEDVSYSLMSQTSVVYQDFCEYHLNVKQNIGLGDVNQITNQKKIERAAAVGGVADSIDGLDDRYDTQLGATFGGRDLSGGQWQKMATARGFFKESNLVIFDEPASALDAVSEEKMYNRFISEMTSKGKTAIIISHRISFARLADRIVVMDNGNIKEEGSHQELLNANQLYAHLLKTQEKSYT